MSHAYSPVIEHVPFHADPVLAAIDAHAEAWAVFQIAPDATAERAETDMGDALDALLSTPCASRFGALALVRHLNWWLREEAENAASYQPSYSLAKARAADLTLFVGSEIPPAVIPTALPLGRLALPVSCPSLAFRFGEAVAALVLIVGGMAAVGVASLL